MSKPDPRPQGARAGPISPGRAPPCSSPCLLGPRARSWQLSMWPVAVPSLTAALGASPSGVQWIRRGYTVALAALLLPAGAFGDRFGRRRASSPHCDLRRRSAALGAERLRQRAHRVHVLTGVGAALIMPARCRRSPASPSGRARQGSRRVGGFAGAGGILGMLVGGALLEQWWLGLDLAESFGARPSWP